MSPVSSHRLWRELPLVSQTQAVWFWSVRFPDRIFRVFRSSPPETSQRPFATGSTRHNRPQSGPVARFPYSFCGILARTTNPEHSASIDLKAVVRSPRLEQFQSRTHELFHLLAPRL